MFLSQCKAPAQQRVTVSKFLGYDARPRTPLGAFARMENLSGGAYPTLSVRKKRKTIAALDKPNGLTAKDCLIWVDGRTLYINGAAIDLTLTDGERQLVSMSAYLLIWPDKMYVNTQDLSDKGSLENTSQTTGTVTFALCRSDGTEYEGYTTGAAAPGSPASGDLWLDTGSGTLMQYDGMMWQTVGDVAMKLSAANIGRGFSVGDGVTVSGCVGAAVDGTWTLLHCSDNAIVIGATVAIEGEQTSAVTVRRYVPDMDFVVECGNRLWGCKYGIVDGRSVNAVYGSALGDFRNWNTFAGLSTDSYAADRGSDCVFTGAAAYLGTVLFFKEHSMERLYISAAGAHQITSLQCPGVKQGSSRSLAVADGVLYFHGSGGVYAFDGSMPQLVSAAFGEERYESAVGGAVEGQYWLSARRNGEDHLFLYDTVRKLWHRQDGLRVKQFAVTDGVLYGLTESGVTALYGGGEEDEAPLDWYAETGELGLDTPEHKYLQRLELRLWPDNGAWVTAHISYDEGRSWQYAGILRGGSRQVRAGLITVRPVRCPQLRLRLSGRGDCRIYSISAVYEKGSDLP